MPKAKYLRNKVRNAEVATTTATTTRAEEENVLDIKNILEWEECVCERGRERLALK